MSKHLTPIQSELLDLARRPQGIDEHEAGQLIERLLPLDPAERTWSTEARGRVRLNTLAKANWLTWDDDAEVFRVGGGLVVANDVEDLDGQLSVFDLEQAA
jgi:hypothetical protein